jgi:hypothetical protein
MPVAVTGPAKAVIDETFPYYAGIYNGKGSDPRTREAIEASDCLQSIGYRPIDGTSGDFTASLPARHDPRPRPPGGYRRGELPGGDAQGNPGSLSTSRWTTTSFQNCGSPGWTQSVGFSS